VLEVKLYLQNRKNQFVLCLGDDSTWYQLFWLRADKDGQHALGREARGKKWGEWLLLL